MLFENYNFKTIHNVLKNILPNNMSKRLMKESGVLSVVRYLLLLKFIMFVLTCLHNVHKTFLRSIIFQEKETSVHEIEKSTLRY